MARQLPFHALTLSDTERCPWWTKCSCVVPISHLTRGHLLRARMLENKHQCSQPISSEQGCPEQRHQYSIPTGLLILFNCNWMVLDVVPSRTIHYRFQILRSPSTLIRHLLSRCYKDKGTWRWGTIIHIIELEWLYLKWTNKEGLLNWSISWSSHSWQRINHPYLMSSWEVLTTIHIPRLPDLEQPVLKL